MKLSRLAAALAFSAAAAAPALAQQTPQYRIVDLGVTSGNTYSQGNAISTSGSYITGRSIGESSPSWPTYIWNAQGGMVAQPNIGTRIYEQGWGVNDSGRAVGVSTLTALGSGALPVMWQNGTATQLNLAAGASVGRAYGINNAGMAVGSVGSGNTEYGVVFDTNTNATTLITALSATGTYLQTATAINNSGLIVGNGVTTGVQNQAVVYDAAKGTLTEITPGFATSLAFGVSDNGFVAGSTGYTATPYVWSAATGLTSIALLAGTSQGNAYAVNDAGWAVGVMGGQYAAAFLFANGTTYSYDSIVVNGAGWNFDTTTDVSARDIANNGVIVGTAEYNGIAHAYMMVPVPEPGSWALMAAGLAGIGFVARRRAPR